MYADAFAPAVCAPSCASPLACGFPARMSPDGQRPRAVCGRSGACGLIADGRSTSAPHPATPRAGPAVTFTFHNWLERLLSAAHQAFSFLVRVYRNSQSRYPKRSVRHAVHLNTCASLPELQQPVRCRRQAMESLFLWMAYANTMKVWVMYMASVSIREALPACLAAARRVYRALSMACTGLTQVFHCFS